MEDAYSVNSPRRTLSYSKRRNRRSVSNESNVFSSSGEFGPKTSEVYGFVGSITTVVATVILLVWAYVPESWLHSVGIFYYPNRQWALIVPSYAMVTIALALAFYIGLNFMSTPPPTSLNIIFDEYSREPTRFVPQNEGDEPPIEPISDINTSKINELMFANEK